MLIPTINSCNVIQELTKSQNILHAKSEFSQSLQAFINAIQFQNTGFLEYEKIPNEYTGIIYTILYRFHSFNTDSLLWIDWVHDNKYPEEITHRHGHYSYITKDDQGGYILINSDTEIDTIYDDNTIIYSGTQFVFYIFQENITGFERSYRKPIQSLDNIMFEDSDYYDTISQIKASEDLNSILDFVLKDINSHTIRSFTRGKTKVFISNSEKYSYIGNICSYHIFYKHFEMYLILEIRLIHIFRTFYPNLIKNRMLLLLN